MLEKDINDKRKERHHITQEDFTPDSIVDMMLKKLPKDTFSNFDKTVLDNSCGIGNFLVEILKRRLKKCKTPDDAIKAMSSIYGVELMADNVEECRNRLYNTIIKKFPKIVDDTILNFNLRSIILNRIVWYDSLAFSYEWDEPESYCNLDSIIDFEIIPTERDTKYPMWYKEELPMGVETSLW